MTELLDKILKRTHLNLSQKQYKILNDFDEHNKINCKDGTRNLYLDSVIRLAIESGKEFEDITKEDVAKFLRRDINKYTRHQYQIYFGKFFKWLGKDIEGWFVPIKNAYDKVIDPSSLWSPEEINALIKVYNETQHRALVAVLYDSEARVSELVHVNISS